MSDHAFLILFALAAYLFAGMLAVIGIVLRWRMRRLFRAALSAKGSIVSLERSVSISSEMVYPTVFPHFRFTDVQGTEHSVRSSVGVQPEAHKVGDVVDVIYDSASPQDAYIDPLAVRQMMRISIFVAALVAVIATGIFVVVWFGFA
ncbi:MAG TPA: DUF3592 domain-containing protein [Verrucomicrobiae bacterium]|jgi:hypothetical protein|nr:DUF3592 domain-containing protein [Verrucomicrobiae bacterium]